MGTFIKVCRYFPEISILLLQIGNGGMGHRDRYGASSTVCYRDPFAQPLLSNR